MSTFYEKCIYFSYQLLVTNDINSNRVKALVKNIELYGINNAVVVNDTPERLLKNFENFFDRILIDAPCSGEGMFRKDENLIKSYERDDITIYPKMQLEILTHGSKMLKVGGKLMYSTCTFNLDENERIIETFLNENTNFKILNIEKKYGLREGIGLSEVARLWPHKLDGEGHFLALLQKVDDNIITTKNTLYEDKIKFDIKSCQYKQFEEENLCISFNNIKNISNNIYSIPDKMIETKNLKVVRSGLLLGKINKHRFEPSQALAMALKREDFKCNIDVENINLMKYLKGETIFVDGKNGLNLITVNGYPLGFGKLNNGTLKNCYDKNWRYID